LIILAGIFELNSQDEILSKTLRIQKGSMPLEQFIEYISGHTGILFSYSSQQIDVRQQVDILPGEKSIREVLDILYDDLWIDYVIVESQVVLKKRGSDEMIRLNETLYSINGYLYDGSTGESLIGATVLVVGTAYGSISNAFGYYSISLPEGKYRLKFSYIGFENEDINIDLASDLTKTVYLKPARIQLPAVLIKTDLGKQMLSTSQMSRIDLEPEQMEKIPEFGGEIGLVKGLQTLPGIKSHSDGSAFFFVRGGEKDQNLIIIDDAPVYNPSHLFGYYSMVIPDFTKDIKIYKSDMPVNLGDRLSSIVDIRTKDGNLNHFGFTGLINPLVSRFSLEGPIFKSKSSFFTSLRFSNIQWIYQRFVPNLVFGFSDLNIKWNYTRSKRNRYFFSFFQGTDRLINQYTQDQNAGIEWNNTAASFRWNHLISSQIFVNTIFIASIYQYKLYLANNNWRSNIANVDLKMDFNYFPRPDLTFRFGLNSGTHAFDPGSLSLTGKTQYIPSITSGKSHSFNTYLKADHRLNNRISYSVGFRIPFWYNTGPTVLYYYDDEHQLEDTVHISNNQPYAAFVNLDPRLSLTYRFDSSSYLKCSYGSYHQYIHLLSNTTSPFTSMETWLPSGVNIKPQRADQFALGYYRFYKKYHTQFSVEMYYKLMKNQIDYIPHAYMLLNPLVESELRYGKAFSYGLEFLLEKKHGKLNGWMSYTYSRVFRKTPDINEGKRYRAFQDRPHDFSVFLNYKKSERASFSANWSFYTGSPVSVPVSYYQFNDQTVPVYGQKNNARLPNYHRLDLAYRYILNKPDSKFRHSLSFAVYNVYARKNPISVNFNKIEKDGQLLIPGDLTGLEDQVVSQVDLMRFMPSISYKFEL